MIGIELSALALLTTMFAGSILLLGAVSRRERLAARLAFARGEAEAQRASGRSPWQLVAGIGRTITASGLLSAKTLGELEETLTRSGLRSESGLGIFVGSKMLGMLALPALAWIVLPVRLSMLMSDAAIMGAAVLGMLLPDIIIRRMRTRYVQRVDRGVADALDMLVICAEAGLGLATAIGRIAQEIGAAHHEVAAELFATESELHVNPDPRVALLNMGTRTGLTSLKRLGATLIQSQTYGTPLAHALRILAAEIRQETLIKFEERAARLPALLTLPMIVFILPSVFMIVGGPAVIQALHVAKH